MWSWDIILALLAVGSAAGFIAGLFGVGGGTLFLLSYGRCNCKA